MIKRVRSAETVNTIINEYLKRNQLICDGTTPSPWIIKKSILGGLGIFSTRIIQPGEIIFKDHPIILGPRTILIEPICVVCYNKSDLVQCVHNCGLPVCSTTNCQNSKEHQKECKIIRQWNSSNTNDNNVNLKLLQCLTPIRSLLLSEDDKEVVRNLKAHRGDQHGFEVDVLKKLQYNIKEDEEGFMKFVCAVLDANAFEVIIGNENKQSSLRGLFPLSSLANHNCIPNTSHVFDKNQNMVVRASVVIPENTEIFHSYSRIIWGTTSRRFHLLKTKHFSCNCLRCCDPTESGTYMSSILCKKCKGNVIPLNPLKISEKWKCEDCGEAVTSRQVGDLMSLLGSALTCFEDDDLKLILKFLNEKLITLVPDNNQVKVELKYKVIWIIGYGKGMSWKELPEEFLKIKEGFCRDLLRLLDKLKLGQCKMRGLLLYELYLTLKELKNRCEDPNHSKSLQKMQNEMKFCLEEAAYNLMYDISAPEEIQTKWDELK